MTQVSDLTLHRIESRLRRQGVDLHAFPRPGARWTMLSLRRFTRTDILKDNAPPRKIIPMPRKEIHQVGDLVLVKADMLPRATCR